MRCCQIVLAGVILCGSLFASQPALTPLDKRYAEFRAKQANICLDFKNPSHTIRAHQMAWMDYYFQISLVKAGFSASGLREADAAMAEIITAKGPWFPVSEYYECGFLWAILQVQRWPLNDCPDRDDRIRLLLDARSNLSSLR